MYPVNPLCGRITTAALDLIVIFYGFHRCPMAANHQNQEGCGSLVLLSFALVISKHAPSLTRSSVIIEHYKGWTKTPFSNSAHRVGSIWKLLPVISFVCGCQMLNCGQEIAAKFGG